MNVSVPVRHNRRPLPGPFRLDIQDKLTLGVAAVFTIVAALGLSFVYRMVTISMAQIDEQAAHREAGRVMSALTPEIAARRQVGTGVPGAPVIPDDDLRAIARRVGAYVAVFNADDDGMTQVQRRAIAALRSGDALFLDRRPADQWIAYWLIQGSGGQPATLVRATIRNPQSDEVAVTMRYAGMLLLALATVVLIALMFLVRWMVVKPIRTLTRNVAEIGASADLARRVSLPQDDEIGMLSREFDRMLAQLASAQRNLMAYSFQAGAQDAAVQALHDIGNAAMPVTVTLDLLRESLQELNSSSFAQRLTDLRGEQDPVRRQAMLDSLQRDAGTLHESIAKVQDLLLTAIRHSASIDGILRRTDRGEEVIPSPAAVAPRDLVTAAIAMLRPDDRTGILIELDASLDQAPAIAGIHPGLYAVFHAILTNAVEAIRAAGIPGIISVRAGQSPAGTVTIQVTDNGVGIPPEELGRVFDREFTTKKRPKAMFNLHWCAGVLAATRGTVRVDSKGRDKGTVVTVSMPRSET